MTHFRIRPNATKSKLEAGECVFGVFVNAPAPRLVELCALAGFDYVVIDAEHGPIDVTVADDMVRAAEATNITPIIRVPENSEKIILRYLDIGAQGIMVPQVNTRAEAERAVRAIKYGPLGQRGLASTRASAYGRMMPLSEYTQFANRETMVLVQIENKSALEDLDGILAVQGIDVFELGTSDLSQSLGYPGEVNRPEVQAVVEEIVRRIFRAGKVVGDTISDPDAAAAAVRRGYRKMDCSLTALALAALSDMNRALREAVPLRSA